MTGDRILIVDDSAQMRDFVADVILRPEGYVVDTARDGAEGLASALANSPHLIITDQAMPELTGLEMVQELRQANQQIPVILITAEGSEDVAVDALRLGIMDYFVKPFDPQDLLEAVNRILRATRIGSLRAGVPDQRRLQALNALIAIGKSITALHDLEMILSRVVEAAVYLSRAEEGVLMLVDTETGELYVRAAQNLQDGLQSMRLPVQDSLAGQVIRTGQPLIVGSEGMQEIKTQYLVRSLLYTPLKLKDQVIGVLGVHNRVSDRAISQQDVAIIAALADYAAIVIANTQLYTASETDRARLARIFDQVDDGILALDTEERVVLCNPVAQRFLEKLKGGEDPVGRLLREVTANRSLFEVIEWAERGTMMQGEVQLVDGRTFNAHVSQVEDIGRVIVMQDITYLKERDEVKSELVEMVSHQVRSPLTAILAYVELMMRTGNLDEQQSEFARQVRHNVRLITRTIDDLLDLGKIEAGLDREREWLGVDQIVLYAADALRSRADEKGLRLTTRLPSDPPQMKGNLVRLRQALINLIDNAIKYTPEGGEVGVKAVKEEGQIVLEVSDSGIGISVEAQPHIFEKFYRAGDVAETYDGTGLGLSIVRSIVEAHDGRIWVESRPGEGTTFTVVLPLHQPEADNRESAAL